MTRGGGEGGQIPPFLRDVICGRPLNAPLSPTPQCNGGGGGGIRVGGVGMGYFRLCYLNVMVQNLLAFDEWYIL